MVASERDSEDRANHAFAKLSVPPRRLGAFCKLSTTTTVGCAPDEGEAVRLVHSSSHPRSQVSNGACVAINLWRARSYGALGAALPFIAWRLAVPGIHANFASGWLWAEGGGSCSHCRGIEAFIGRALPRGS